MPGGIPAAGFAARDLRTLASAVVARRDAARPRPRTTVCHPPVGAAAGAASSGPEMSMPTVRTWSPGAASPL
eukprot:2174158-Prymnesium_polylepis.1